jgi:hypothetical protein
MCTISFVFEAPDLDGKLVTWAVSLLPKFGTRYGETYMGLSHLAFHDPMKPLVWSILSTMRQAHVCFVFGMNPGKGKVYQRQS